MTAEYTRKEIRNLIALVISAGLATAAVAATYGVVAAASALDANGFAFVALVFADISFVLFEIAFLILVVFEWALGI